MRKPFRQGVKPPEGPFWTASEHDEQKALIAWWSVESKARGIPENLLFAIPNGGRRDAVTGRRLRDEGVRAGIPDLFLAVPAGGMHGLFVEMKQESAGSLSPAQKKALADLKAQGYAAVCEHGWTAARKAISSYLDAEKPCKACDLPSGA